MFAFPKYRLFDRGRKRPHTFPSGTRFSLVAEDTTDEPGRVVSLVCVGDLTPDSASADLLDCAVLWVEGARGRSMSISWAGDGDLRGVLAAQPLPEALSQRFFSGLFRTDPAALLRPADLLCVLSDVDASSYLVEVLRAEDVAVVVARGCKPVVGQLRGRKGVWLFDERRPATLMAGLESALETILARRLRCDATMREDCAVYA
jgi:hypothetical protein